MFIKNKRGQGTMEYAIIIAVVVAALIAIDLYMKRAKEGGIKQSIDQIGEQFDAHKTTATNREATQGTTVEITSAGTTTSYNDGIAGSSVQTSKSTSNETVEAW